MVIQVHRLCALPGLPGVLQSIADVGPAADGALQHHRTGQQGCRVDPPGLTAPQVNVRLRLPLLVTVMTGEHLPLPHLTAFGLVRAGLGGAWAVAAGFGMIVETTLQTRTVTTSIRRREVSVPQFI